MKKLMNAVGLSCLMVACVLLHACGRKTSVEKTVCGDMTYDRTVVLQVDTLLYSQIADFVPIGTSAYVLTDGVSIYKTDSTGAVTCWVSSQGHGNKEYIKVGKLYSDGRYIYAWCDMSLNLYKYDLSLNFIDKP